MSGSLDFTFRQGSLGSRILALTGIPSRSADLPATGRVQYTRSSFAGEAVVRAPNRAATSYGLTNSTVTLTVDFAARTIVSEIRVIGTPRQGGADILLATVSGTAGFDGQSNIRATAPDYPSVDKAIIAGAVFGPAAAEAGFLVNLGVLNRSTNNYLDIVMLGFGDR